MATKQSVSVDVNFRANVTNMEAVVSKIKSSLSGIDMNFLSNSKSYSKFFTDFENGINNIQAKLKTVENGKLSLIDTKALLSDVAKVETAFKQIVDLEATLKGGGSEGLALAKKLFPDRFTQDISAAKQSLTELSEAYKQLKTVQDSIAKYEAQNASMKAEDEAWKQRKAQLLEEQQMLEKQMQLTEKMSSRSGNNPFRDYKTLQNGKSLGGTTAAGNSISLSSKGAIEKELESINQLIERYEVLRAARQRSRNTKQQQAIATTAQTELDKLTNGQTVGTGLTGAAAITVIDEEIKRLQADATTATAALQRINAADFAQIKQAFSEIMQSKKFNEDALKGLGISDKEIEKLRQFKQQLDAVMQQLDRGDRRTAKNAANSQWNTTEIDNLKAKLTDLETNAETARAAVIQAFKDVGLEVNPTTQQVEQFRQALRDADQTRLTQITQDITKTGTAAGEATSAMEKFRASAANTQKSYNTGAMIQSDVQMLQNRIAYFFGINNVINLVRRSITQAYNAVKELDEAMTEIAIVSKYTIDDMWGRIQDFTSIANNLGVSISDAYEATTLYVQQGMDLDTAITVAEETLKMSRISGLSAADSTDAMTAALRGFNMEVNAMNAQHINDVYSALAASSASNVEELATAMSKTASIAANAGMSFENTATFLAQAIEVTREAPEAIGTMLKTVTARFTEVKSLIDENKLTGEDEDGEVIDVNKVTKALRTAGINMNKVFTGELGLDEVFLELAQKWDSLSVAQQRYIATTAAGSRQQSRFIAMMSDYSRTIELQGIAMNSAGASDKQFEKTVESLQSKLQRLSNAWTTFTTSISNSGIIKSAVDGLTNILTLVNSLESGLGNVLKAALSITALLGTFALGKGLIGGLSAGLVPGSATSFGAGFAQGLSGSLIGSIVGGLKNTFSKFSGTAFQTADGLKNITAAQAAQMGLKGQMVSTGLTGAGMTAVYAAQAAAVAALVAAIAALIIHFKKASYEAKNFLSNTEKIQSIADETAKSYDELETTYTDVVDKVNQYNDDVSEAKKMTNASQRQAALTEATAAAWDLISDYNLQLNADYQVVNGEVIFNTDELEARLQKITNAKQFTLDLNNVVVNASNLTVAEKRLTGETWYTPGVSLENQIAAERGFLAAVSVGDWYWNGADTQAQYTEADIEEHRRNLTTLEKELATYNQLTQEMLEQNTSILTDYFTQLGEEYGSFYGHLFSNAMTTASEDAISAAKAEYEKQDLLFLEGQYASAMKLELSDVQDLGFDKSTLASQLAYLKVLRDLQDSMKGVTSRFEAMDSASKESLVEFLTNTADSVEDLAEDLVVLGNFINSLSKEDQLAFAQGFGFDDVTAMLEGFTESIMAAGKAEALLIIQTQASFLKIKKYAGKLGDTYTVLTEDQLNSLEEMFSTMDMRLSEKELGKALETLTPENFDEFYEAYSSIDFSNPINGASALDRLLHNSSEEVREMAAALKQSSFFGVGSQVRYLLNSEDFEDNNESLDELYAANGEITADNINDLRDSCEDLDKILKKNTLSTTGLAKALTAIRRNGVYSVDDLTDAVLAAMSGFDDLNDVIYDTLQMLDDFDAGMDEGKVADFNATAAETMKELMDNGEYGNSQLRTYTELLLGKGALDNVSGDELVEKYQIALDFYTANSENMLAGWRSLLTNTSGFSAAVEEGLDGWVTLESGLRAKVDDTMVYLEGYEGMSTSEIVNSLASTFQIPKELAQMLVTDYANWSKDFAASLNKANIDEGIESAFDKLKEIGNIGADGKAIFTESEVQTIADAYGTSYEAVAQKIAEKGATVIHDLSGTRDEIASEFAAVTNWQSFITQKVDENGKEVNEIDYDGYFAWAEQLGISKDTAIGALKENLENNNIDLSTVEFVTWGTYQKENITWDELVTIDPTLESGLTTELSSAITAAIKAADVSYEETFDLMANINATIPDASIRAIAGEIETLKGNIKKALEGITYSVEYKESDAEPKIRTLKDLTDGLKKNENTTFIFSYKDDNGVVHEIDTLQGLINALAAGEDVTVIVDYGDGTHSSTVISSISDLNTWLADMSDGENVIEISLHYSVVNDGDGSGTFGGGFGDLEGAPEIPNPKTTYHTTLPVRVQVEPEVELSPEIELSPDEIMEKLTAYQSLFDAFLENPELSLGIEATDENYAFRYLGTRDYFITKIGELTDQYYTALEKLEEPQEITPKLSINLSDFENKEDSLAKIDELIEQAQANGGEITFDVVDEDGNVSEMTLSLENLQAIKAAIRADGTIVIHAQDGDNGVSTMISSLSAALGLIQQINSTPVIVSGSGGISVGGSGVASGRVHSASGRAYASGSTLVGELGPEMVVDPHSGRWYTVGDYGAEMVNLPDNAIVFNHLQTRGILENGHIFGRGKALAGGNAFAPGSSSSYGGAKKSSSGGSDSGSNSDSEAWENPYDWLYSLTSDWNEALRAYESLADQYEKLLKKQDTTVAQLYNNLRAQEKFLNERREYREAELEYRKEQMTEFLDYYSDLNEYATFNWDNMSIDMDWDKINAVTDSELGERIEKYVSKLEEIEGYMDDAVDDLEQIESDLLELETITQKEYTELEDRVVEALVKLQQNEIDKLQEIDDSVNSANSDLLSLIRDKLDKIRQDRDNEKTERELAEKQQRLAYLRQDTSNANQADILALEKELSEETEDYTDQLVDQKLSEIESQNDLASQQREKQIELLQSSLDAAEENGVFNQQAAELIQQSITLDGQFRGDSTLADILKQADNWDGMSKVEKDVWAAELIEAVNQANVYLARDNQLEKIGQTSGQVTFTDVNGTTHTGTIDSSGNVSTDGGGKVWKEVFRGLDGNYYTYESEATAITHANAIKASTSINNSASSSSSSGGGGGSGSSGGSSGSSNSSTTQSVPENPYRAYWNGSLVTVTNDKQGAINAVASQKSAHTTNELGQVFNNKGALIYGTYGTKKTATKVSTSSTSGTSKVSSTAKIAKFATGGLADYTGPAWLDGSTSDPELVLNPQDTRNFIVLKDVLANVMANMGTISQGGVQPVQNFEINVNAEIANDYDVDRLTARIQKNLTDTSMYRNVNTINRLR